MPRVRKQLLAPGTYYTRSGPFVCTRQDIRNFYDTGCAMLRAGVPSPVPLEHQLGAVPQTEAQRLARSVSHNTGWVSAYHLCPDGSLDVDLDVSWLPEAKTDADIEHRLTHTIKYVSPEICPVFQDGAGKVWKNAVTHVALTPVPVWSGQRPFGWEGKAAVALSLAHDTVRGWGEMRGALQLSLADCVLTEECMTVDAWQLAVMRAPKGYTRARPLYINGKPYIGGQVIPNRDLAQASPEEKQGLEEALATKTAHEEALRGRVGILAAASGAQGHHDLLAAKVHGHADLPELKDHEVKEARRAWNGLKSYHGDDALLRLQELIHGDAEKLTASAGPERARLMRRMSAYKKMLGWHQDETERKAQEFDASKTGFKEVSVKALNIDPHRFQYKLNVDKDGVVHEGSSLEGVKTYNPYFAGLYLIWHDPVDHKDYIINGHHRFDLARRAGVGKIPCMYLDVKDESHARAIGALANIANGNGTSVDAAKFMRETHRGLDDFEKEGVSVKGAVARDALALTKLHARLFQKLTLGQLPLKRALLLSQISDEDAQVRFSEYLDHLPEKKKESLTDRTLQQMVEDIEANAGHKVKAKKEDGGFGDIFGGGEDEEYDPFLERSQIKAEIKARLTTEANLFGNVGTEKKAAELEKRSSNKISAEENKKIATEAEQHRNFFDQEAKLSGPLAEMVRRAGEDLYRAKSDKQRKAIRDRAFDEARQIISRTLAGGISPHGGAGEENPGGGGALPGVAAAPVDGAATAVAGRPDKTAGFVPKAPREPLTHVAGKAELTHQGGAEWKHQAGDELTHAAGAEQAHAAGAELTHQAKGEAMKAPPAPMPPKPPEPEVGPTPEQKAEIKSAVDANHDRVFGPGQRPLAGNTFAVKDQLRALGARWNRAKNTWTIDQGKLAAARELIRTGKLPTSIHHQNGDVSAPEVVESAQSGAEKHENPNESGNEDGTRVPSSPGDVSPLGHTDLPLPGMPVAPAPAPKRPAPHTLTWPEARAHLVEDLQRDYGVEKAAAEKMADSDGRRGDYWSNLQRSAGMGERIPDRVLDSLKPGERARLLHDYPQTYADYLDPEARERIAAQQPLEKEAAAPAADRQEAETEPTHESPLVEPKAVATPAPEAPTGPYTFDEHRAFRERLRDAKVTADEVRANYDRLVAHEDAIKGELNHRTLKQLAPGGNGGLTKAETVDRIYNRMLQSHLPAKHGVVSYSQDVMAKETPAQAMRKALEKVTDQDIQDSAAERLADLKQHEGALTNPQTLADFRTFAEYKGAAALTPEQQARYDDLQAGERREREKRATPTTARQVDGLGDVGVTLHEGFHERQGKPTYVAQLTQKVEREKYTELLGKAKLLGGYYSSFRGGRAIPGFQFPTKEASEKFAQLLQGDVSLPEPEAKTPTAAAAKLRGLADGLRAKAEESLGRDRETNTHRRANQAAGAIAEANSNIAFADTMNNVAQALESGEAKHLAKVTTKAQLETLKGVLTRSVHAADRKATDGNQYELDKLKGRSPIPADAAHAEYPYPSLHREMAASIARDLANKPGAKLLAARLLKQALAAKGWQVQFKTEAEVKEFKHLRDLAKLHGSTGTLLDDGAKDYDRLQALDIQTPAELRAALRELAPLVGKRRAEDPVKVLERKLVGRDIPGFFPTPPQVVDRMLDAANIQPGMKVLEPSAGKGDILDAIKEAHPDAQVDALEISHELKELLHAKGHHVVGDDFTAHPSTEQYDRILMNPPFEHGQDMAHVQKAYTHLKPGGKLVAIVSEGAFGRGKDRAFRDWLKSVNAEDEKLPEGSFAGKDSFRKTGVGTRLVVIDKGPTQLSRGGAWSRAEAPKCAQSGAEKCQNHNESGNEDGTRVPSSQGAGVSGNRAPAMLSQGGTFDESKHPRDRGKFAEKAGSSGDGDKAPLAADPSAEHKEKGTLAPAFIAWLDSNCSSHGVEVLEDSDNKFVAGFRTDVGDYKVTAECREPWRRGHKEFRIDFEKVDESGEKHTEITGTAGQKAIHVFRKVAVAVGEFVNRFDPHKMDFVADNDLPSRVKLYDRLASALATAKGYSLTVDRHGGLTNYSLVKSDLGDTQLSLAGGNADIVDRLKAAVRKAHDASKLGPDYQLLFWDDGRRIAWWVSADGDDDKDVQRVLDAIGAVKGVRHVSAEAEGGPPKEGHWTRVRWEGGRKQLSMSMPLYLDRALGATY